VVSLSEADNELILLFGKSKNILWQMPWSSLANAVEFCGKCHGNRWQMPATVVANAANGVAI
jgi:hypothetical protein